MLKSKQDKTKRILFLLSGSIAAYKAAEVVSSLVQSGYEVQTVMTPHALDFIGAVTFEGLTDRPVLSELFARGQAMDHIHWDRWADLIIFCPATANSINKLAHGIADDLVTNLFLAHDFKKPFLIAPAMNSAMYTHPTTQHSLARLLAMGVILLEPSSGALACREFGPGRLMEVSQILQRIDSEFKRSTGTTQSSKGLVLITSGGTQEPIDSMRVLTNQSTGQTGAFLAEYFYDQGFDVHYLGAVSAQTPNRPCLKKSFVTFQDLDRELQSLLSTNTYWTVIHAAAVSDFHVSKVTSHGRELEIGKGKVSSAHGLQIELEPNFKILNRLKDYARPSSPFIVGFKYTSTPDLEARECAVQKILAEGGVDCVVHNDQADINRSEGKHFFTIYSTNLKEFKSSRLELATALVECVGATLDSNPKKDIL